jgi:hypothetical protein
MAMAVNVPDACSHPPTRKAETIAADTTLEDWIHVVRAEYLEMPGLHLTRDQVRRLWALDDVTCNALLIALVEAHFLRRTPFGTYARADQGVS